MTAVAQAMGILEKGLTTKRKSVVISYSGTVRTAGVRGHSNIDI